MDGDSVGEIVLIGDALEILLIRAVDQAMEFYQLPDEVRNPQIARIMVESKEDFSDKRVVADYNVLYKKLDRRPL